jgi:AP-4 complex subunit mu-1
MVFNSSGYVINSGLSGSINMKSYLKNNPQLKLSLNEHLIIGNNKINNLNLKEICYCVKLDDCNFHESVNLSEFDINRTLIINPPDG